MEYFEEKERPSKSEGTSQSATLSQEERKMSILGQERKKKLR